GLGFLCFGTGHKNKDPAASGGLCVEGLEGLDAIPAADVDGVQVADHGFRGEVAVAAEDVADVGVFQQDVSDRFAAEVGLGEIPLPRVRWGKERAEGEMMYRGDDRVDVRQRGELTLQSVEKLVEKFLIRPAKGDVPAVV